LSFKFTRKSSTAPKVLYPDFAKSIFIGGDLSGSCLSSWQIKHFDQSVLCFSWADKESRILFDIVNNNQKQKLWINKRVNCKHYHGTMVQLITVKLCMGFSVSFVYFKIKTSRSAS
jgi:hypothetical protein